MIVDFSQVLTGASGRPIRIVGDGDETQDATLGAVAVAALYGTFDDERSLGGEEKYRRHRLAMQIAEATDPVDLRVEDIAKLKSLIGKAWPTLISGAAWGLLDPE